MNIEADLKYGPASIGYFAYDDVSLTKTETCETLPGFAMPQPKVVCLFEEDMCGWTTVPSHEGFDFTRLNGAQVTVDQIQGPSTDFGENDEGFFLNADSNGTVYHGAKARVYTSYFNGTVNARECMHFYYSMEVRDNFIFSLLRFLLLNSTLQHNSAVETVFVETISKDDPIARVAWTLDTPAGTQPQLWNLAQVPLQASDYRDYQVIFFERLG